MPPFDPCPPCNERRAAEIAARKSPYGSSPEPPDLIALAAGPTITTRRWQTLETSRKKRPRTEVFCPCAVDICGQYRDALASVHLFLLVSCRRHSRAGATMSVSVGLFGGMHCAAVFSTFGAGSPQAGRTVEMRNPNGISRFCVAVAQRISRDRMT